MNEVCAAALFAASGEATRLDRPVPELLGVLAEPLLDRVGAERGEHVAGPWQDAERRAEHRAASDRRGDAAEVLARRPQVRDRLRHDLARLLVLEIAQDLGDAEQADCHRHEVDALEQLAHTEREAGRSGVEVLADRAEQEAEDDHRQRLDGRAAGQGDRRDQPEHNQAEELGRAECQRDARQRRREEHQHERGNGAGDERADGGRGKRRACSTLPRHLVAVDRGDRGRRLPRQVDEDRRRRAAVLRAVVDACQHDQRRDRVEPEGDRQQERDRGGRTDPRQDADRRPEHDADEAIEQVLWAQRGLEPEREVLEQLHRPPPRPGSRGRSAAAAAEGRR